MPSLAALEPGSLIDSRFEIVASLGSGGMGLVFRARDRVLDEAVALKVLPLATLRDPGLVTRFRSEIRLARRVRHRNVCAIHEYGECQDALYVSMELIEGCDLRRMLASQGPMLWEDAYDAMIQASEGLAAIHEAGVIHRDLKPANLMLDAQGVVRILDFGIAKALGREQDAAVTSAGHVVGSPEYMSPEQVRGRPLDARSDVYSLGVVTFEVFTGLAPFRAETPIATMLCHLEGEPPLWAPQAARLPAALLPVLRGALAKDPDARPASAAALRDELRTARAKLEGQTTEEQAAEAAQTRTMPAPVRVETAASVPPPVVTHSSHARHLVPVLLRALRHADPGTRLGAARALGRIGKDARPALAALDAASEDSDEGLRAAATRSIAQIGAAD
jgi:serine/threonine-protein kinase